MNTRVLRSGLFLLFAVSAFLSAGMMRATDVLIPLFSQSFQVGLSTAGLVTSAYALAYGLFQLLWAPLGDRYGKPRVVGWVLLLSVVGNVLSAIAWSIDLLVLSRVLVGATSAGIIPLVYAWIADNVEGKSLSPALARVSSSAIAGMIFIQWLSGLVAEQFHWRWLFVGLSLVLLIIGISILRLKRQAPHVSRVPEKMSYRAGFAAVLGRRPAQWLMLITIVHGALFFGFVVYSPTYLYQSLHFGLSESALVVAMYGVGGMIYAVIIPWVLRLMGDNGVILLALLCLVVAMISITLVDTRNLMMVLYFFLGFGYYALQNQLTTCAVGLSASFRGTSVSVFTCAMFFGISLGVSVMGLLLQHLDFKVVARASVFGFILIFLCFGWLVRKRE